MPSELRRVLVVANPAGGRGRVGRTASAVAAACRRHGLELHLSRDRRDLAQRAARAGAEGVERVIVLGGDGTAHWALQGLARTETALGIVPLGSGNDLAAEVGMPLEWEAALVAALEGPVRPIDLLRLAPSPAASDGPNAGPGVSPSAAVTEAVPRQAPIYVGCVAGVGFDSEVNRYANGIRRLRGRAIYIAAVLRVLARFQPIDMTVETEGRAFRGRAMFAVFANSSRYGGGMRIAPQARLDDGRLELVLVRAISRFKLLRVFPRVFAGGHVGHPQISFHSVERARIALGKTLIAHGDGEPLLPVDERGVEVAVVPGALRVVAPAIWRGARSTGGPVS